MVETSHTRVFFMVKVFRIGVGLFIGVIIAGCSSISSTPASPTPEAQHSAPAESAVEPFGGELVIYSGRSEPLIQPVLDAFQKQHPGILLKLKAGSNSELANALIEEAANPVADIFITTELFTIQALNAKGIFQAYAPADIDLLPEEFIGEGTQWVGLTKRARVIMYNTELVTAEEAPKSIFELTDPKWKGQIAAAGSTNGSMQAQIATMRMLIGEERTEEWLNGLLENQVTFFGGHTDVRKAVGAGEFKLGLVNHYYYHLQLAESGNVGVVYPDQGEGEIGLITNATAAAIIQNAPHTAAAQAFIDFLTSAEGQKLFAELNFEYPLRVGVGLRAEVEPLDSLRLAEVDVVKSTLAFEETFALVERIGLP